jgi:hypothetical protein
MTSFIRFRFLCHGLIFCPQLAEDLFGGGYAAGVSIGDAASKRSVESREPSLALMKEAKALAQYFAL